MKRNLRVYLKYPWKFPDSPYYKYLLDRPPNGIDYINSRKQEGVITKKRKFIFLNTLKKIIRKSVELFFPFIPNAHPIIFKGGFDLIHCAHCLSLNKKKPWVADIETANFLFLSGKKTKMGIKIVKKILLNENCKRILPWTENTKEDILKIFPECKNKIEVIYPAVPLGTRKKRGNRDRKIRILYATRYFWLKGGLIALEVYRKLKKHYGNNLDLIFISDVPKKTKMKYSDLKIKNLVSQKEMVELYSKSDIFFYPSFMDTFGFGQLEAMSFGLPIVTLNTKFTKSRKEIVKNDKNGLIIDIPDILTDKIINKKEKLVLGDEEKEIIKKLFENCCKLIDDKKIRNKLSRNSTRLVKGGKFSIRWRNKKLRRIYGEILKLEK